MKTIALILCLASLPFANTVRTRANSLPRLATLADSTCIYVMTIGDTAAKCLTLAKLNAKIKADSTALRAKILTDSSANHN